MIEPPSARVRFAVEPSISAFEPPSALHSRFLRSQPSTEPSVTEYDPATRFVERLGVGQGAVSVVVEAEGRQPGPASW